MTISEPTTGEIVRALREDEDVYFGEAEEVTFGLIADRLESQEQKLELLNGGDFDVIDIPAALAYLESVEEILPHASALIDLIQSLKGTAIELTARAEQAERERDAAIKFIRTSDWCAGCENMKNLHCDFMKECANPHDLYKLRGLPQDGEGK